MYTGRRFPRPIPRADAQFLRKALAGEDIVMKILGPTQVRSFLYAKDAARAILTLLSNGRGGQGV